MRRFPKVSPRYLVWLCLVTCPLWALPVSPQPAAAPSISSNPRELLGQLDALRLDPAQVYNVSGLELHRDVIHLSFETGKLAFFRALGGRVTGAVFSGTGHLIAIPRGPGERRSVAQYLGVPVVDLGFSSAYLRFDDASATELQKQLRQAGSLPVNDPEFANAWAPILGNLNPSQSLRIMMDWLSADPVPFFYAGLLNDAVGPFEVLVDGRRSEQVLMAQNRLANGAYYYDVWASFRAMDSDDAGSRPPGPQTDSPAADVDHSAEPFLPVDYRVDTTIGADLSLDGATTLRVKAARGGEQMIALELSRNLAVESITMDGAPLVFFQNDELSRREALQRGNDAVLVVLPAESKAGQTLQLRVVYRGNVIFDAGNGVKYVGERGAWYAHLPDHEFVPFDLTFRWPKRFTLVATGTRIESTEQSSEPPAAKQSAQQSGRQSERVEMETGRWVSQAPFAVAGFNLGEYKMETAGSGKPSIRLYANSQLEEAILARLRIAAATSAAPTLPTSHGRSRTELMDAAPAAPPRPADVLNMLGDQVSGSIQFFEKLNGPFPFDHLDISQIPSALGQSWPELVYLSTLAFLPARTEEDAGIADDARAQSRELMPAHEVAHQWWGNEVDAASYRDVWIEEGMAHYMALLYDDSRKPSEHRMEHWLDRYREVLEAKSSDADEPVGQAGPLILGYRLNSSKVPGAYAAIIYGKGAWVMHMLHEMLRDPASADPDARFRGLLRSVLSQYRFRTLSTEEFEQAVNARMTPQMDLEGSHTMQWFFDEWVRDTSIPTYRVQYEVRPRGAEFVISGQLEQTNVNSLFTARIPLYASLGGGKSVVLGSVVTTGAETPFHFVARERPRRLLIDPHRTILCRTN